MSMSHSSAAGTDAVFSPVRGLTRSQFSFLSTAFMNASVMPTEMLKLLSFLLSFFMVMNVFISGCETSRMPMLAPLRVPPCFTTSVV